MKTIHKEKYRGYKIKIYPDENAWSPKEWGNDDVFLVYDHDSFYVSAKGFNPNEIFERWSEGYKTFRGYYMIPVEAYIHSGVHLSIKGCGNYPDRRWDVSFKGFALVRRGRGVAWKKDKAIELTRGLLEEWNQYLSGDVYGYEVPKLNESCWGYYGLDYAIQSAKYAIDYHVNQNQNGTNN